VQKGLARRVLAGSVVVVALTAGAATAVAVIADQLQDSQARRDQLAAIGQVEAQLLTGYVDEETGLRGYLLTGEMTFLAPYQQAEATIPTLTATLRSQWAAAGGPTEAVSALETAHEDWVGYAQAQIAVAQDGRADQARTVAATGEGKELFDAIRSRERALGSWLTGATARVADRTAALQQRLTVLLTATLAALLVVTVAGCVVLWRSVARPLARLARATRAVATGNLSAELPATGAPEMRSLAADLTAMRDRLTADLHSTRRSLEALEQTGPAVSALRAALQPAGDQLAGVAVAGRLDPAEGVLAGDWYDTVALSPTRLGLVLGDVAGHGPRSAVFALRLKHSLITALRAGLEPGQALTGVCADLVGVPGGQFATAFLAVVDTERGTVVYANAGHPAGLLLGVPRDGLPRSPASGPVPVSGGRLAWRELATTGPLLSSAVLGCAWNTATAPFGPGDLLLAYTDGVTETRDGRGTEFGTQGILEAVGAAGVDDGARLVEAIAAASMRFGGSRPRRDDHTIVCLQRRRTTRRSATTTTS
jgi:sigma-B regulation protein RsbU (phosphoserine phosphatase)